MSDADRLRAAADQCDAWAADTKAANSALLTSWKIDAATAELLRAVAEEGDHDERISGFQLWPNTYDAALALVDVILGGTDE